MTKVTAVLLVILLASAAGLVTSKHQARKLYADLEREQQTAKQIEVEWGQLQIEQSTFSMHSHIEKVAASRLRMATPATQHVQMLYLPRGATR